MQGLKVFNVGPLVLWASKGHLAVLAQEPVKPIESSLTIALIILIHWFTIKGRSPERSIAWRCIVVGCHMRSLSVCWLLEPHPSGASTESLRRASHNLLSASHTLIIRTTLLSWLQRKTFVSPSRAVVKKLEKRLTPPVPFCPHLLFFFFLLCFRLTASPPRASSFHLIIPLLLPSSTSSPASRCSSSSSAPQSTCCFACLLLLRDAFMSSNSVHGSCATKCWRTPSLGGSLLLNVYQARGCYVKLPQSLTLDSIFFSRE